MQGTLSKGTLSNFESKVRLAILLGATLLGTAQTTHAFELEGTPLGLLGTDFWTEQGELGPGSAPRRFVISLAHSADNTQIKELFRAPVTTEQIEKYRYCSVQDFGPAPMDSDDYTIPDPHGKSDSIKLRKALLRQTSEDIDHNEGWLKDQLATEPRKLLWIVRNSDSNGELGTIEALVSVRDVGYSFVPGVKVTTIQYAILRPHTGSIPNSDVVITRHFIQMLRPYFSGTLVWEHHVNDLESQRAASLSGFEPIAHTGAATTVRHVLRESEPLAF